MRPSDPGKTPPLAGGDLSLDENRFRIWKEMNAILAAGKGLRRNDCYLYPVRMDRP
ncbi:MAG: hypothetical protein HZB91_00350 [Elusimicrobia bacterium]|nr:hypothetical protein [Elusimicrobiota bacterium]